MTYGSCSDALNVPIGVIGTGLFLGTATALANGGPVGMLLGYMVIGSLCYTVMVLRLHYRSKCSTDES